MRLTRSPSTSPASASREVRGRVGRGEVHREPAGRELHRHRRRHGGLADAALAHDHHQPVSGRGDLVHQRREGRQGIVGVDQVRRGGGGLQRVGLGDQSPQRVQSDEVVGLERHFARAGAPPAAAGARAAPRRPGAPAPRASGSAGSVARKTAFTISRWLPRPRSASSPLVRSASVSALASGRVDQDHRGAAPGPRAPAPWRA